MKMKRVVLCADDYALAKPVSDGILELVEGGRLSAVSCLMVSDRWPEDAKKLLAWRGRIDIGLHFCLTAEAQLRSDAANRPGAFRFSSFSSLIVRSLSGLLDREKIESELNHQLDRFIEHIGQPPDFIDGHRHIHQLPTVRDALLSVYNKRLGEKRAYIRNVAHIAVGSAGAIKAMIVSLLGARKLERMLVDSGIPHNRDFGGVYGFSETTDYRRLMRAWLGTIGAGGVLMCHPGQAGPAGLDSIGASRNQEYTYLRSQEFIGDCREANISIGRYRELERA